ncbi:sugar ABC transporter ATP-binding protein (plasmid) [Rhizobium grahamii]|uniref:Sugar ABC transporter ATP-binding protein n=1 Tax=Rhizobium grahamii TaxID=1120045 RepID=A0A5Q0CF37_9HYPH|nr:MULTISPECIES: sugar ABC transporter ATP-binding protein [Rhizobium]QFY63953.1 sugar ABC transporter ATP-binding protein [Rhizobium grahamii]QRM52802.1 sugar ABC transporter ATP-binding protein [Rhizobium sp. BG6]
MNAPILETRKLSKSYAGVPALKDGSLAIAPGEVHALMGENGAGKSTLIRILAGATKPDAGAIFVDGAEVSIEHPSQSRRLGLRFIHQELSVIPELSVAENLFLGRPYPRRFGIFANWRELNRQASKALDALDIGHIIPSRKMARLSLGDQMLVKIAAAFLDEDGEAARVYVMDEPTAALTSEESERLFKVIAGLTARGRSIVYVSHRMDEVMRIADRVSVLRDGETVATRAISSISKAEMIEMMTGRQIAEAYPPRQAAATSGTALSLTGASSSSAHDISFELHAGEILGITGLSGAGQSDILRLVIGADKRTGGGVELDGRTLAGGTPATRWADGIAYVPRERRREGLLPRGSVADNTVLAHLRTLSRAGILRNRRAELKRSADIASRVKLKSTGVTQPVFQLSGGNQQKVVLARAILGAPRVLLLDEPTRGVDVAAKFDIHTLVRELAASGVGILLASSDLSELIGMTDRILVMREGRQVAIVPTDGLTQTRLLALSFGEPA